MTIKALTHTTPVPLLVYFLDLVCTRDVRRTVSLFYGTTGLKLLSTLIPLDKSARNLACSCGFTKPISLRSVQTFTLTGLKRVVTNLTNAAAIFVPPGQFTKYKESLRVDSKVLYISHQTPKSFFPCISVPMVLIAAPM